MSIFEPKDFNFACLVTEIMIPKDKSRLFFLNGGSIYLVVLHFEIFVQSILGHILKIRRIETFGHTV